MLRVHALRAIGLLVSLASCSAIAGPDPRAAYLDQFSTVAFRKAGPREVILPAKPLAVWMSQDGQCLPVDTFAVPESQSVTAGGIGGSTFAQTGMGYFAKQGLKRAVIPNFNCPGRVTPPTRAHIDYVTAPKRFAAQVATFAKDPAFTIRYTPPAKGHSGCAVFLAVRDHLIHRAETLVLVTPENVLKLEDRPSVACALRGAMASFGMLGALDPSDDELLSPSYQAKAHSGVEPIHRNNGGHFLFWTSSLQPGMSEAEARKAAAANEYYEKMPVPDVSGGS